MGNLDLIKVSLAFKQARDSLRTLKDIVQAVNQDNKKIIDNILLMVLLLDSLEQKL